MPEISMRNMLAAGVHYGHQTQRWNPKMRPFIFGPRNGIYIIDLEQTVKNSQNACQFVKKTVAEGGKVLFVATKNQAKNVAKEAATRAGMPFVTERWLGGTLTNFATIRKGCEKMEGIEKMKEDGTYEALPKKEIVRLERKLKKLVLNLGGLRDMKALPSALFVVDPMVEKNAVAEANRLGIPVVAVVDTNCNPDPIDYVIPGNDDAIKSVSLFVNLIADSCTEGSAVFEQKMRQSATAAPQKSDPSQEDGKKASGPVVERVVRRQLKIPTEIDYREDAGEDEETTNAEQSTEAANVEASATGEDDGKKVEAKADAKAPEDKPADKAAPKKADKKKE